MESFIEVIAILLFALLSIVFNERARAKRAQAQKALRPPPRPQPMVEIATDEDFLPHEEPTTAQDMMRRLQDEVLGLPVAVEPPPPPPPPVVEAPVVEIERPEPLPRPLGLTPQEKAASTERRARRRPRAQPLLAELGTPDGLRRAILMREILGPPRAFEEHGQHRTSL